MNITASLFVLLILFDSIVFCQELRSKDGLVCIVANSEFRYIDGKNNQVSPYQNEYGVILISNNRKLAIVKEKMEKLSENQVTDLSLIALDRKSFPEIESSDVVDLCGYEFVKVVGFGKSKNGDDRICIAYIGFTEYGQTLISVISEYDNISEWFNESMIKVGFAQQGDAPERASPAR